MPRDRVHCPETQPIGGKMEASQSGQAPQADPAQPADPAAPQADPAADPQAPSGAEGASPDEGEGQGAEATPTAADEQPSEDEANPAREQAPVATEAQEAIIGDQGQRSEQQPQQFEGGASSADVPVRTSPPPPNAQSGVPLPEDRAAGVEPGTSGPVGAAPEGEDGEPEAPDHDASEGQSTTPPMG